MAGDIGKGVEFGIAACQVGIRLRQLFSAYDDQVHDHAAQLLRGLDLDLAPRPRAPAHLFLPQVETAARGQARTERADGAGLLVRIAGPAEGLHLLAPKPQDQRAVGVARDGRRQHAAGQFRELGRGGIRGAECVGGVSLKPVGHLLDALAQPRGERLQLPLIRGAAGGGPASLLEDRHTLGLDAVEQVRRRGARDRQRAVACGACQHGQVHRVETEAVLQVLAQLGLGDFQRCNLRQELGGAAQRTGPRPGRVVMTGNQPPKRTVAQYRHRQGGGHTHVLQVLGVHHRCAAQRAMGHFQRALRVRVEQGHHLAQLALGVGQGAHADALEDLARRPGDVTRRVAQPPPRSEVFAARVGHHLAAGVGMKVVDHRPVEAGDAARLARHHIAKLRQ